MLLAVGFLRLGTFIKYIPYPVTVGFTAGIAVIIFASQLKELLGLALREGAGAADAEAGRARGARCRRFNPSALAVAALTIGLILALRRLPAALAGLHHRGRACVASASGAAWPAGGDDRHALRRHPLLAAGAAPAGDLGGEGRGGAADRALLRAARRHREPALGGGGGLMSGRRHRSNCELVAQGVANIGSALFGGFCVTGTIARTATNVRSGARGPVAGMLHAVFLLLFMLVAAPLAAYMPLAALAAVLAVVAWNMAEKHDFATLLRASRGDAVVLLATFLLVVFRDLTEGILVGFGLGALLFLHRMAQAVEVEHARPVVEADKADAVDGRRPRALRRGAGDRPEVVVYRISGAFFFGTAASGCGGARPHRRSTRKPM